MRDPLIRSRVQDLLRGLDPALDPLGAASVLRRALPADLARRAAALHGLRRRAAPKLARAEALLLTARALEQSSATPVARRRAARIRDLDRTGRVLDATAGIGGDAMALAEAGLALVAAERDPLLVGYLRANLALVREAPWVVQAAAEAPGVVADVLVLDPDRRAGRGEGRQGDPGRWGPPLSACLAALGGVRGGSLKLPPALDPARVALGPLAAEAHRWQWVSLAGELKELCLWTGTLAGEGDDGGREALVLARGGQAGHTLRGAPRPVGHLDPAAAREVAWIAEPDPAVIRAGLVGTLAAELGLAPLGPGLAYLGGDRPPASPFARSWRVLGHAPADPRRVRALCAAFDVGRLTVKKRGHPDDAETLARRLRGSGARRGLLLVARLERGHHAYLVEPVHPTS